MALINDELARDLASYRTRGAKVDLSAFKEMLGNAEAKSKKGQNIVDEILDGMGFSIDGSTDAEKVTQRMDAINNLRNDQLANILKDTEVKKYLAKKYFHTDSLQNIRWTKNGEDDRKNMNADTLANALTNGDDFYMVANEIIGFDQERKALDALSERRATLKPTDLLNSIARVVLRNRGFDSNDINEALKGGVGAIETTKKTKVADIPAMIERGLSTAVSNGKTKKDFIDAVEKAGFPNDVKEAVGHWIIGEGPDGEMIFDWDQDDVKNIKYEHLAEILVSLGIFNRTTDGYEYNKNVLLDSAWNLANVWSPNQNVNVSEKEYNAFMQQIQNISDKDNRNALAGLYSNKFNNKDKKNNAINRVGKFNESLTKTYNSKDTDIKDILSKGYKNGNGGTAVTIGKGKNYSVDVTKLKRIESDYKNGKITEEEYNNSVFGEIETVKQKILSENPGMKEEDIEIIFDAGGQFGFSSPFNENEEFAGRFVYIPSVAALKDEKGQYTAPEFNAEFSRMVTSGGKYRSMAIKDFEQKIYNEANQKDSSLYQQAHSVRMGNSKSGHAIGIDPGSILDENGKILKGRDQKEQARINAQIAGVFASKQMIREMLRFDDREMSIEDYEKSLRQMLTQGNYSEKEIDTLLKDGQQNNYKEAINKILKIAADPEKGIAGVLNRFPTISRMGVSGTKLFLDDSMIGNENIKLGVGIWKMLNGDFDGDTANLILPMLQDKQQAAGFEEVYAKTVAQAMDMAMMSVIADYNSAPESSSVKLSDIKDVVDDPNYAKFIGIASKNANKEIGTFSNYATRIRNAITDKDLNTLSNINKDSSDQAIKEAVAVRLTEMFGQSFEQDVISSKKISDKYSSLTEEGKAALITQYDKFNEQMHNGGLSIDEMMGYASADKFGLIKDGKMSSQPVMLALAELRSHISKEQADRAGLGWLYGDDAMAGGIGSDIVANAMKYTEGRLGNYLYKDTDQFNKSAATSRANLSQNYGDTYQLVKFLKAAGVESEKLGETIQTSYSQIGSVIGKAAEAVDAERVAEQNKIGVAVKEGEAIGKLTDKYRDLWEILQAIAKENGKNSYKQLTPDEITKGLEKHGAGFGSHVNSVTEERNEMIVNPYNQMFAGHALTENANAYIQKKYNGVIPEWKKLTKEDKEILGVTTQKQLESIARGSVVFTKGHLFNMVQLLMYLRQLGVDPEELKIKSGETDE